MGLYKQNKKAKVGDMIICPVCHTKFKKRQYSQVFCCSQCKDKFHNWQNKDRHKYRKVYDDCACDDHEWDEAFSVAEYND